MISNLVTVRAQKPPAAAPYRPSDLALWPITSDLLLGPCPQLVEADMREGKECAAFDPLRTRGQKK
jgi:hypothetical protein